MTNRQKLAMTIADMLLDVADASGDMPRGDLQGYSEAQAAAIINLVLHAKDTL